MTLSHIEDTVFRWQTALYNDLINGRIASVQFVAGIEAANAWALGRYAKWETPDVETDICPTTSF